MSRYHQNQLAALLSLLLLLQGMLPMQLHTKLVRDQHGVLVEVCTIDGLQSVTIDFDTPVSEDGHSPDKERTAAMALSDLMSEATPDLFAHDLVGHFLTHAYANVFAEKPGLIFPEGLRPIRAPPIS